MTQRVELSGTQWVTYTQAWDIDNKLIAVTNTVSSAVTRYHYNADGERVIRDNPDGTQVVYVHDYPSTSSGHSLEQNWDGIGVVTSYYNFGSQRVAMWQGNKAYWLHGDHLGSASVATSITGAVVSEMRYFPFGETRWVSGTLPTDMQYAGQRVDSYSNIIEMGARWYSALLGRFLSSDSVVPRPGDSQAYNRYAYARNSPLTRVDPSGHADCAATDNACWTNEWMWKNRWYEAHGNFWDGTGWGRPDNANFRDWDILRATLGEFGVIAFNGSASWLFDELVAVAQGAVALMNKVGGSDHLKALLGTTVYFIRDHVNCFGGWGGGVACVSNFRDEVRFTDSLFSRLSGIYAPGDPGKLADTGFIRGTAVHELAHVMDFRGQFFTPAGKNYGDRIPKGFNLGAYANANMWGAEYFADAVAGWVYNLSDGNWLGRYRTDGPSVFPIEIINWLDNELAVHP